MLVWSSRVPERRSGLGGTAEWEGFKGEHVEEQKSSGLSRVTQL